MHLTYTSVDLRRWAMECYAEATDPRASGDERDRLMRMRTALLALAEQEDWLAGKAKSSLNKRPVRMVGRRNKLPMQL